MNNGKLPDAAFLASLTPMLALLEFKAGYVHHSGSNEAPVLPNPLPHYANPAKRWVTQAFKAAYDQLFHVKPVIK